MKRRTQLEEKNSITFEVIRYITLYYFSVAAILTLSQIGLEYFKIKSDIEGQIKEIESSFSESLTNSLWEFNEVQTKAIIDGIAKSPAITYVTVKGVRNETIYGAGNVTEEPKPIFDAAFNPNQIFVYKKKLSKNIGKDNEEEIGQLYIYSGNSVILSQLSHIVVPIIVNSVIKTIFLWMILLLFINNKLKGPLNQFVENISEIDPKNPKPVDLKISKEIKEFDSIQTAFNDLIRQLKNYKDVLEAIVENKTELLKEKNDEVLSLVEKLKSAQSQILKHEKLTSLGILSAGIAHELKNPLNLSQNTSIMIKDLIKENQTMDPAFKSQMDNLLGIAVENQERMNGIIKNMLLQARVQNSEKTELNIKQFIDTNFNILLKSRKKNAHIDVCFENLLADEIKAPVFANDFGRLLLNLFENALHSIEDKSKKSDPSYKGLIKVSGECNSENLVLSFYDNGKGIEKSYLDKIWEPFFTTKPTGSGTGLGLYLTYEIIKQHNGSINIESEEGAYAKIIVELPLEGSSVSEMKDEEKV
ncbi:MAG: hypothetical protein CME64_14960 [Halobacteriovoraceae bacterium]|nr:hypothetical protein [Halobacteriovoraceae bacterium]|tara:strand:- start:36322 stop:37914 length:1593 start_codon:yes stop_codon:yes gene_type:complete